MERRGNSYFSLFLKVLLFGIWLRDGARELYRKTFFFLGVEHLKIKIMGFSSKCLRRQFSSLPLDFLTPREREQFGKILFLGIMFFFNC